MKTIIVPVHHFYGPMKGAEFIIDSKKIALSILKDKRLKKMESRLFKMTAQAWRFMIVTGLKNPKGVLIKTKEQFFDPKGENHQLIGGE